MFELTRVHAIRLHMSEIEGQSFSVLLRDGRSVSVKSAIGLSCLSIMTLVCPASNGEQAIARVG